MRLNYNLDVLAQTFENSVTIVEIKLIKMCFLRVNANFAV
jgi:hypothetical protein